MFLMILSKKYFLECSYFFYISVLQIYAGTLCILQCEDESSQLVENETSNASFTETVLVYPPRCYNSINYNHYKQ